MPVLFTPPLSHNTHLSRKCEETNQTANGIECAQRHYSWISSTSGSVLKLCFFPFPCQETIHVGSLLFNFTSLSWASVPGISPVGWGCWRMPSGPPHLSSPGSQHPFPLQSFLYLSAQEVKIPTWVLTSVPCVDTFWSIPGRRVGTREIGSSVQLSLRLLGSHFRITHPS